ncbi:hypothetical protein C8J57DRAFT_1515735 [Mycena rebaudengoi]|nr:hypothetical protein C8J57DRAFT_1515735 [Mycena rebaudengoi]
MSILVSPSLARYQAPQQATSANGHACLAAARRAVPLATPAACCQPARHCANSANPPRLRLVQCAQPIRHTSPHPPLTQTALSAVAVVIAFVVVPADDQDDFASQSGRRSLVLGPSSYPYILSIVTLVRIRGIGGDGGVEQVKSNVSVGIAFAAVEGGDHTGFAPYAGFLSLVNRRPTRRLGWLASSYQRRRRNKRYYRPPHRLPAFAWPPLPPVSRSPRSTMADAPLSFSPSTPHRVAPRRSNDAPRSSPSPATLVYVHAGGIGHLTLKPTGYSGTHHQGTSGGAALAPWASFAALLCPPSSAVLWSPFPKRKPVSRHLMQHVTVCFILSFFLPHPDAIYLSPFVPKPPPTPRYTYSRALTREECAPLDCRGSYSLLLFLSFRLLSLHVSALLCVPVFFNIPFFFLSSSSALVTYLLPRLALVVQHDERV